MKSVLAKQRFIVKYVSIFMDDSHHPIKAVARRTGLSAHVIRIWEKRYGAVQPERTDTNRRLYSEEQIERLSLLRDITQSGHSIGPVATLPTEKLRQLAAEATDGHAARAVAGSPGKPSLIDDCIVAVKMLDSGALEDGAQTRSDRVRRARIAAAGDCPAGPDHRRVVA